MVAVYCHRGDCDSGTIAGCVHRPRSSKALLVSEHHGYRLPGLRDDTLVNRDWASSFCRCCDVSSARAARSTIANVLLCSSLDEAGFSQRTVTDHPSLSPDCDDDLFCHRVGSEAARLPSNTFLTRPEKQILDVPSRSHSVANRTRDFVRQNY